MRRRFLAFVCCFGMLASLLPCSVKANGRTTNVNLLETPEEVAEVFYRQNASLRKSKGVTAQDQQNEIRKRVIVESAQTLENTYGAVKTYYYTVGGYQILLYDSADQAELAVTNLKKDYPGVHIFQDIPVPSKDYRQPIYSDNQWCSKRPCGADMGFAGKRSNRLQWHRRRLIRNLI